MYRRKTMREEGREGERIRNKNDRQIKYKYKGRKVISN
jgi:hypothetical protein